MFVPTIVIILVLLYLLSLGKTENQVFDLIKGIIKFSYLVTKYIGLPLLTIFLIFIYNLSPENNLKIGYMAAGLAFLTFLVYKPFFKNKGENK